MFFFMTGIKGANAVEVAVILAVTSSADSGGALAMATLLGELGFGFIGRGGREGRRGIAGRYWDFSIASSAPGDLNELSVGIAVTSARFVRFNSSCLADARHRQSSSS